MKAATSVIHPNVRLEGDPEIQDFVVIGLAPKGRRSGELPTRIGPDAFIRSHTVIYAGNVIGAHFQSGHSALIRESNKIGAHVSVGSHSVIEFAVTIADRVRIHSNAFIPEYSVLEEGCWIGPNAVLTNADYPLSPRAKENLKGVIVRRGAKIGANATILPGVVIGEHALIGAGAVVTRDVAGNKVVIGNPARVLKDITDIPDYQVADLLGASKAARA